MPVHHLISEIGAEPYLDVYGNPAAAPVDDAPSILCDALRTSWHFDAIPGDIDTPRATLESMPPVAQKMIG
jgi:hypothetical protein